jgi:hypothetical protein
MATGDKYYTSVDVELLIEGVPTTTTIEEPSDGNVPGLLGMRSYRCVICGLCFKENDVTIFRGKPYGKPCGCSMDIKSILQEEREDRKRLHR